MRPIEAWRAMRRLLDDPEKTSEVFVIIRALSGNAFERLYQRVLADPVGRRVLEERLTLLDVLCDRDALEALPEGSLGREYAKFTAREGITAEGLVEASRTDTNDTVFIDPRALVLSERLRDTHDLWHVVTGYGRDLIGEDALLAFSYAQIRNRGIGFIVLVALFEMYRHGYRHATGIVRDAYRRGRDAALLPAADWEALLEQPLDDVRRTLRVGEPVQYEPVFSEQVEAARA